MEVFDPAGATRTNQIHHLERIEDVFARVFMRKFNGNSRNRNLSRAAHAFEKNGGAVEFGGPRICDGVVQRAERTSVCD